MKKIVLIFIFALSLNANINLAVKKIIGTTQYNTHQNLINFIFQNKNNYYINGQIDYLKLSNTLKNNGLLKLKLPSSTYMDVHFKLNNNSKLTLNILQDILKKLGHYYYFTKEIKYDNKMIWKIKLKTESAINPLHLSRELANNNCNIIDIKKEGFNKWYYEINSNNIEFSKVEDLTSFSELNLKKSYKPYIIKINNANVINISSKYGNKWHPSIVFYDNEMNILEIFKEDMLQTSLQLDVPEDTKYIKIDDLYSLYNLKRGISITKE